MSTIGFEPVLYHCGKGKLRFHHLPRFNTLSPCSFSYCPNKLLRHGRTCFFNRNSYRFPVLRAGSTNAVLLEPFQSSDVFLKETFPLIRTEKLEGRIFVRLAKGKGRNEWELTVGCDLSGKWILHWGVSLIDDTASEWDQPPKEMIPPGSIPIKDYAIETPMKKSSSGDVVHEVKIDLVPDKTIAAINFVLKDEETGIWYQHKGRDFKVPLLDHHGDGGNIVGTKKGLGLWPGWGGS